jgi:DNA polymerase
MYTVRLKGRGDLGEWRDAARAFLQGGVLPERVVWEVAGGAEGLFAAEPSHLPPPLPQIGPISVPPDFIKLAGAVICHSDVGRFSLLYRLLFRLMYKRRLLEMLSDVDVVAARQMAKSVGRDYHKMSAFVRFKEIALPADTPGRRRFVAWFEPDHFIVERVAPFFQRRFNDMDWLIATPKGSASWDGEMLRTTDEPARKPVLKDETEDLWRTYYASIFNPARLKVKAMTSEMPKKYWKNLPEADLIPGMIANAERSVLEMAAKAASEPLPFHHRLQEAAAQAPAAPKLPPGTLASLKEEARHCTRCDLHCMATQTVFGDGPSEAKVMVVGEQPGDQEDLAGKPFVGPAGQLFNDVLREAGFDRRSLYVTNAVKHFKYEARGKRRIHQKPNMGEIQQCRWWLSQEIELVKPKLVVAMGATAYFALTDEKQKLSDVRSKPMPLDGGRTLFVTVHPSYLLRIPDGEQKAAELLRFKRDIESIQSLARSF